jgi:methylase of polypeptide subunit release factors
MIKEKNYRPFNKKTDFTAIIENGDIKKLKNIRHKYSLPIRDGGYVPKTGIFVTESIAGCDLKGKRVLDIGTGDSGILAIHAAALGAREVIGLDVDGTAVRGAQLSAKLNGFGGRVKFRRLGIQRYKPSVKFDVIISNPPQMPVPTCRSQHDDGGPDGRKYIRHIISFAARHLKKDGVLFLTAFDFLGIDGSYGCPSLCDYARKAGLCLSIVGRQKKEVKENSYTQKNIVWIKRQYPKYSFMKSSSGRPSYKICLLMGQKL